MDKRIICIATGTRADWGLLSPVAEALAQRPDCDVRIVATNMHLSKRYGMTVNEIIAAGFDPVRVPIPADDDTPLARAKAMSACMNGMADVFDEINPDMLIILGDRYEMLAVASAAAIMRIPIVHIAGGTISEGAIDDSIRHAITKLASLHFAETEEYRRRIIAMGEQPDRVINTGAIGVWNIGNMPLTDRQTLSQELDFDLDRPFAIATFHPATLDSGDPGEQCRAMLDALEQEKDLGIIITYPNNDSGSAAIIKVIENFALSHPDNTKIVKSLGLKKYLSALQYAEFTIGNSSSGIVEVASAGIPSIDIGIRQRGRTAADSVIHCGNSVDDIRAAIRLARSDEFRALAAKKQNPYFKPDTLRMMTEAIMTADTDQLTLKQFYDLPSQC